jgi:YidC/Oxa1 family membrane protein insertase
LSPDSGGDGGSQAEMMSQQMQIMMPLMFGFISLQYATGLSIYFIISNLFGMAQYYFIRSNQKNGEDSEIVPKRRPKK